MRNERVIRVLRPLRSFSAPTHLYCQPRVYGVRGCCLSFFCFADLTCLASFCLCPLAFSFLPFLSPIRLLLSGVVSQVSPRVRGPVVHTFGTSLSSGVKAYPFALLHLFFPTVACLELRPQHRIQCFHRMEERIASELSWHGASS